MTQWEYGELALETAHGRAHWAWNGKAVPDTEAFMYSIEHADSRLEIFRKLGLEGWELILHDKIMFIFKRPLMQ